MDKSTIGLSEPDVRSLLQWGTKETEYTVDNPDREVVFEPISPNPYNLSYACLQIPRFRSHYLIGDLGDTLYRLMPQICLSFGWRLDFLNISPDFLQWVMTVPAATSPSTFMQVIRRHTSRRIFEDFPRVKRTNLSKDFWAPGYLVLVGTQPHPPEMVAEYIRLTRQQQGHPPS